MKQKKKKKFNRKLYTSYDSCSAYEKSKLEQGYKRLAEYPYFYVYGKFNSDGVMLYRECFSKFDVDGVAPRKKKRHAIFKWFKW